MHRLTKLFIIFLCGFQNVVAQNCEQAITFKFSIDSIVNQKNYHNSKTAYYFTSTLSCGYTKEFAQNKLEILLQNITDSFKTLHNQALKDKVIIEEKEKNLEVAQKNTEDIQKKSTTKEQEYQEKEKALQKNINQVTKKMRTEKEYAKAVQLVHTEPEPTDDEILDVVKAIGDRTQEGLNTITPESDSTADYYRDLSTVFYKLFPPQDSLVILKELQKKYFLIPNSVSFAYSNDNPVVWNNSFRTVLSANIDDNKPHLTSHITAPKDAIETINIGSKKVTIKFTDVNKFATVIEDYNQSERKDTFVITHSSLISSVCLYPKNNNDYYLVSTGRDSVAKLWVGQKSFTMSHKGFVNFAKFSPNGKYIVTCSNDKTAKLWDVKRLMKYGIEKKALIATFTHTEAVTFCLFDKSSNYLLTDDKKRFLRAWILPEQIVRLIKENNITNEN